MKIKYFLLVLMFSSIFLSSCGKDDDSCDATYNSNVRAIIENSCAYAGCHAGAEASMWVSESSKDYTNFAGMQANITDGSFVKRVLEQKNMPPDDFIPEGRPTELTAEEIEILTCWQENNFPES